MRTIAVLAALLALLSRPQTVVHAEDKGDTDRIQGTWTVTVGEKAGRKASSEELGDGRMTFLGGKLTWKMGEKEMEGTFSLDMTRTPGGIAMSLDGKGLVGIYRLSGDELTIYVGAGDDRPTDFATRAGAKTLLLVLKRERR
jgi:uncharacterized protein (TIGR03067 family)